MPCSANKEQPPPLRGWDGEEYTDPALDRLNRETATLLGWDVPEKANDPQPPVPVSDD